MRVELLVYCGQRDLFHLCCDVWCWKFMANHSYSANRISSLTLQIFLFLFHFRKATHFLYDFWKNEWNGKARLPQNHKSMELMRKLQLMLKLECNGCLAINTGEAHVYDKFVHWATDLFVICNSWYRLWTLNRIKY